MEHKPHICRTLFTSMFMLSAFTFGGGFVIIPLMRKKFVEELHWLEEQEMLDAVAMAQSSPGAVTVNVAVQLGDRLAGLRGVLAAVLGTLLPPLILLCAVSYFYDAFRASPVISAFLKSMQAAVAAVIAFAMLSLAKPIAARRRPLELVMMIGAFIAGCVLRVNVVVILLFCGLLGALLAWRGRKDHDAA